MTNDLDNGKYQMDENDLYNRKYKIDDNAPGGGMFPIYNSNTNKGYEGGERIFLNPSNEGNALNQFSEGQNGGTSQAEDEKREGEEIFSTNEKKATHTTNTQPEIESNNQLENQGSVTLVIVELPTSRTQD